MLNTRIHCIQRLCVGFVFCFIALLNSAAHAQRIASAKTVRSIVYHGKLVSPDGRAVSGDFSAEISIYSPEPSLCLLWSEKQSITVRNGGFSLELGYDSNRLSGGEGGVAQNFPQVFINNSSLNLSDAKCAVGTSYTSSNSEDRLLRAVFTNLKNGAEKIEVAGLPIKAVPFALQAEAIGGYGLANLVKISGTGSNVVFSPDEVSSLSSLLGGNALWDMGSKRVTKVAAPVAGDDAANMAWVQSQLSAAGVADGGITTVKLADGAVTSVKLADGAVSFDKIQNVNSGILIGRASIGAGSIEEISLGAGLSITGGVLNTTNAGVVTSVSSTNDYLSVANGTSSPSLTVNVGTTSNTVAAGDDSRITGALQRSGGTMTGALNMGGQDLTAVGNFALSDDKHLKLGSFAADPATAGWGNAEKGRAWFNTTTNQVKYWDGSSVQSLGVSGAGLTSLNGQSGGTQTFAEGTAGTDFDISSSGNVHTFNLPSASGSARGLLTAADWTLFNSKQPAGSYLTGITGAMVNTALGFTPQPAGSYLTSISGGDVTAALGYTPISAVLPNGQVYVGNGSGVAAARYFGVGDLKTALGAQQFPASCSSSQTLNWSAVTDTFSCVSIGIGTSNLADGSVATAKVADDAITFAKIQNITSGRILGRSSGGSGDAEEISIGSGLSLSGGTLSASGSGGTVTSVGVGGLPLSVVNGSSTPTISIAEANGSQAGYLSAADWTLFNSKQPAGAYLTGITGAMVNSALGFTPVNKAGDSMTGTLNLPSNGLTVGTGQLVVNGGNIGVGTASPGAKLEVAGQIKITGGTPGAGKVLQSDADGLASWVTPSVGGGGTVTQVFVSGLPLTVSNGTTTPTIGINQANGSQAGFLSAADWTAFNAKQPAGSYLTAVAGTTLTSANFWVGNGSNQAAAVPMSGDVTMTNTGATTVGKINNTTVTGVGLANNNVLQNTSGSAIAGNSVLVSNGIATGVTSLTTPASGVLIASGTVPGWSALSNDNFTQYALLAGRSGGQTLNGGTAASNTLTLDSTSHATKGNILLNPSGGNVGIGTTSPSAPLHVASGSASSLIFERLGGALNANIQFKNTATSMYAGLSPSGNFGIGVNQDLNSSPVATFTSAGSVGIGTTSPGAKLEVAGQIKITGGSPGAGKVLQSDASGLASWVTLGGSESTSVSNIGTAGVGIYKQMTGTDIELKKINAGSSAITITDDTANNELDINLGTVPRASVATGTANHVLINDGTGNLSSEAVLAVSRGGTGASSITANRLMVGNGTSSVSVLAAGTSGQMLQSAGASAPAWSTATYPATTTINQLLYSSAANTVSGLATANSSVLLTNGSGVPAWGAISSDTFTQYALLAGRAGGQSLRGGTAASEDLTLESTSHATKGDVIINPTSGNVGIGTTTPSQKLDVVGTVKATAFQGDGSGLTGITASSLSSTLGVAGGGTGATTLTSNGVVYGNGTSAVGVTAAGSAGQILRAGPTPAWSTATFPATTTINQILYSSAANTVTGLATTNTGALVTSSTGVPSFASGATANRVLRTDGTTVSFGQVALSTDVTDTLPVANGGTGASSITANRLMVGNGTSSVNVLAAGTSGQMLQSAGASAPAWSTATYPGTTTINQLLYSSAANTVTGLATANSSVLLTNGSGVPAWGAISSDTFTQYALLAGRSGGQTLYGGTAASNNLTLDSTSNATKGSILLNPSGGSVGVGTSSPDAILSVRDLTALGNNVGDERMMMTLRSDPAGNTSFLRVRNRRHTAGTDWAGTQTRIQRRIDVTDMGFIDFGIDGRSSDFGVGIGSGTQTNMAVLSSGNVGIGTTSPTAKLEVAGQFISRVHNNGSSLTFNFNNGNQQYTSSSCGTVTLQNMLDGGSYSIAIQGTTAATCTFSHGSDTFRFNPANGPTTAGTETVYTFMKFGSKIYVSWITGFN